MANLDDITNSDIANLKAIRKKLKLSLGDLIKAQKLQANPKVTPEEAARKLLKVPANVDLNEFLESRLSYNEIETMKKLMG